MVERCPFLKVALGCGAFSSLLQVYPVYAFQRLEIVAIPDTVGMPAEVGTRARLILKSAVGSEAKRIGVSVVWIQEDKKVVVGGNQVDAA